MTAESVLLLMLGSFFLWSLTHLALALRLTAKARPWYRGLVALVVVPLVPYWTYREGWRRSASLWVALLASYVAIRLWASSF